MLCVFLESILIQSIGAFIILIYFELLGKCWGIFCFLNINSLLQSIHANILPIVPYFHTALVYSNSTAAPEPWALPHELMNTGVRNAPHTTSDKLWTVVCIRNVFEARSPLPILWPESFIGSPKQQPQMWLGRVQAPRQTFCIVNARIYLTLTRWRQWRWTRWISHWGQSRRNLGSILGWRWARRHDPRREECFRQWFAIKGPHELMSSIIFNEKTQKWFEMFYNVYWNAASDI